MATGRRITVIGAGPGGYVAAIRAAQLGAQVSLIEDREVGGACLNRGCIPSKALLFHAEVAGLIKRAADFGLILPGEPTLDVGRMLERKRRIVQTQARGIEALLKSWGVSLIRGRGRLTGPRTVEAAEPGGTVRRIETDRVILATGSMPIRPEMFPFDGERIITSEEALEPRDIPKSLLIVGAGIEGCEFAFMYSELGAAVTLVEVKDRPLSTEDEEISDLLLREMKRRRMALHFGTRVEKVSVEPPAVSVALGGDLNVLVDRVLVSIGRRMNTGGLGLEAAGVAVGSRGEIRVNERMETNVEGVYAIGDCTARMMLAHVASAEGKVAAANAASDAGLTMEYGVVPSGIFTIPEIGTVGLKEREARERGLAVRVGRYPFRALGRAQTMNETAGLVKVIADAGTDRLLGAQIIGPHASDLIHEAALAIRLGARAEDIGGMIHAHPTLSEAVMEASEDAHGLSVHQMRRPSTK